MLRDKLLRLGELGFQLRLPPNLAFFPCNSLLHIIPKLLGVNFGLSGSLQQISTPMPPSICFGLCDLQG